MWILWKGDKLLNEDRKITDEEFNKFIDSLTQEERIKILQEHSKKNTQGIQKNEIEVISNQFQEFLKAKGLKCKFKLAIENIKENAKKQHEIDKERFEKIKENSYHDNKAFEDMLKAKGIKAKIKLIVEGFKNSAKESKQKTKESIQVAKELGNPKSYSIKNLTDEFNSYLKSKGLSARYYLVEIKEKDGGKENE